MIRADICHHCEHPIQEDHPLHLVHTINGCYVARFYHTECVLSLHGVFCEHLTRTGNLKCEVTELIEKECSKLKNKGEEENDEQQSDSESNTKRD